MAKLIMSAFADEYCDSFSGQLEMLASLGIEYIELRRADGRNVSEMDAGYVKKMGRMLEKKNISVSSVGSPIGKISIDGDIEGHLALAERVMRTANYIGAKYMRIFSFYIPKGKTLAECRKKVLDALEKLVTMSEKFGVRLCHENEALIYGESIENCLDLLRYFNGALGCVLDAGNFVLDGYDAYEAYKKLFGYIDYFHVKDALSKGAVVPPGKGEARLGEILQDYAKNGVHDAFITLEPHLQTFGGLNALVGKSFENPYKYKDEKTAFLDAYKKLRGLI